MQLPTDLRASLEAVASRVPAHELMEAATKLSDAYRSAGRPARPFAGPWRFAYAVTRMPATYAVARRVLHEVGEAGPFESLLDIGSGPGAVCWAARDSLPPLARVTAIEGDFEMVELSRELGTPAQEWRSERFTADSRPEAHDLVVLSYAAGEFDAHRLTETLQRAWSAAAKAMVVIEPGTPAGFGVVRKVRELLTGLGAWIAAPCPHGDACPMTGEDWCHFAERVERTHLHRLLKRGALGYEDEKYSYVVGVRSPAERAEARIVRHPQIQPGLITLRLCGRGGLENATVRKSEKPAFRAARGAKWGDRWPSRVV